MAVCITGYSWGELLFILFRFGGSAFCVSPVFVRGRRVYLLLLSWQSLLLSSFAFALFFHLRYRSAGGLIDWRLFLNLSKMMYRLVFSGILWLAGVRCLGSKIQNLMGSSSNRFVKRGYLCDPDYEMMGIFVSPIIKK